MILVPMQEVAYRRRSRQRILQWLYANHMSGGLTEASMERIRRHFPDLDGEDPDARLTPEDWRYTSLVTDGLMERLAAVDSLIQSASKRWRIERMDVVSLSILRIGTFELAFVPDVPPAVILSEAVALSERYGDGRSVSFVNGLLEQVRRSLSEEPKGIGDD